MPFERFDGSNRSRKRHARTALLRRIRVPALVIVTVLAAVLLFERSSIQHSIGQSPRTKLGWQSFKPAYYGTGGAASSYVPNPGELDTTLESGTGLQDDYSDDWWWDMDEEDAYDGFLAPTSETWNPFQLNTRPLTEITAKACLWPPSVYDACMPESTVREDQERGQWIRVEKDLNLRVGIYYLYLFYRRLPPYSRVPTIREFKLLTASEEKNSTSSASQGWHKVSQNLRDGIMFARQEPIYLYYRTEDRKPKTNYQDDEINEIDVVWGSSGTLYGWNRMHRDFAEPKEKHAAKDQDEGAELMWRKGSPVVPQAPRPLSFSKDGKYKIVQIADLHFSVAKGKCRDSDWPGCKATTGSDNITLHWLNEMLDAEKPDLVILSGDQLNGQDTSYSGESVVLKVAKLFENRKIPWAAVLGNHDSEKTTLTRYGLMVMMQSLPYFVGEPGPIDVDGEGNYVLRLYSADESRTHIFTLYFLDSHAYASSLNPWSTEYDYIKDTQIEWFNNESRQIKPIERPFTTPVIANSTFGLSNDIDLRSAKKRLSSRQVKATTLKKPNAMAIYHIPLPEVYDDQPDMDAKAGAPLVFGTEEEGRGAPKKNSGFFEKALLYQTEFGPRQQVTAAEVEDDADYAAAVLNAKPEVKVALNGHCHITDQCRRIKGVWNCFAGGSSYSGYGKVGFDRRVRVYEISDYGETIETYKILDTHTDHSGQADVSGVDVTSDNQAVDEQAGYLSDAQLEAEIESLETGVPLEPGLGMTGPRQTKRQMALPSGSRQIVDRMVLVGKGAPA